MKSEQVPHPPPFSLPEGTRVGDWRVVDCLGHGAYGVVHRAVRVDQEAAGLVALKLAVYPWEPRFMREVALLSLVQHPGVPRLCGHGFWKNPAGTVHPYIVMDWVEGTPLYAWAQEHNPTSRQVLQLLAQLARVLQATHAASAVHRDVKGENVLVRRSDGRAMLMDFSAGHYQRAARLTWQAEPPGTPAYRSPEAGLFWVRSASSPNDCYVARPSDDIFALGVTAYRLVTGEYPAEAQPQRDAAGRWHMVNAQLQPPGELNSRVAPQLSALILRMLSLSPEARGTAEELAEAFEAAARREGPEVDQRLRDATLSSPPSSRAQVPVMRQTRAVVGLSACALLMLGVFLLLKEEPSESAPVQQAASEAEAPDAGTADVGDTAPSVPLASAQAPSKKKPLTQDTPSKPFPGQRRPDAKGRCAGGKQVPINGGCWVEYPTTDAQECTQNGYLLLKNRCYAPVLDPHDKPVPTSSPTDSP